MNQASPAFTRAAIAFLVAFTAIYCLTYVDIRLLNGVNVWEKPAKFLLSLGIHMATLAWGISLLPEPQQKSPGIRRATLIFIGAALFEMAYLLIQAARGEASHFNQTAVIYQVLYSLMGLGALMLTLTTAFIGWRIRGNGTSVMSYATGWAFVVAALTTTLVAGYLSSRSGHWVGGDPSDATGLPFLHWSTTGGDLRVPHFAALHIMQAVPLIVWFWPDKRLAQGAMFAGIAVVAALFLQSASGIPLLRV